MRLAGRVFQIRSNRPEKGFPIEWLCQGATGADLFGQWKAASGSAMPTTRHGDDGGVPPECPQRENGFNAVLTGHDQIDQEKIEPLGLGQAVRLFTVGRGHHLVTFGGKKLLQQEQDCGFVVHYQNSFQGSHMR